jgi:competence protein ComEC
MRFFRLRVALPLVLAALALLSCAGSTPRIPGALPPSARATGLDPGRYGPADRVMRIHFIDVGQGDAILLEFPCAAMLVDTGGEKNEAWDGMQALQLYLERFFARRADLQRTLALLVITHPHLDHTLGIQEVLFRGGEPRYRILNVVSNGQESSPGGPPARMLRGWARAQPDVKLRLISADDLPPGQGLTDEVIDPIACRNVDPRITALWGRVSSDPGWGRSPWGSRFDNENNHSVVLRVDFGEASLLATGDLEQVAIHDMMQHHRGNHLLDVDIYKVAHHGSYNATRRDFLRLVTPELAVISMGPADRHLEWTAWQYGHPRAVTVKMLAHDVSGRRPPVRVPVASRMRTFSDRDLDRAIYATGWDGTVVVEATVAGELRVFTAGRRPRR